VWQVTVWEFPGTVRQPIISFESHANEYCAQTSNSAKRKLSTLKNGPINSTQQPMSLIQRKISKTGLSYSPPSVTPPQELHTMSRAGPRDGLLSGGAARPSSQARHAWV
jgi:hypothetical protein